MEIYTRHITAKLRILRLLPVMLLLTSLYSFSNSHAVMGYACFLAVIFAGFIRVTGLTIYYDSVQIERYYLFGFIPVKWLSDKNDKNSVRLFDKFESMSAPSSDTLADIILPFFPAEAKFRGILLKYKTPDGSTRSIYTSLNSKEYNILAPKFTEDNTIAVI